MAEKTKTDKPEEDDFDPALPLHNAKWEAFVCEYLKNGRNATRAYLATYPNSSHANADTSGPALLGNPRVRARYQALAQQALFASGFNPEAIVGEFIKFGFKGSLRHFLSKNAQGEPTFDFTAALDDPDKMDTLGEISIDSYYDQGLEKMVKSVRLKLESRQDALKTLATMQGLFAKDNAQKASAALPPIIVQTGIEASPNVSTVPQVSDEHE